MAPSRLEISLGPAGGSSATRNSRRPQLVVIVHTPAQGGREPALERLDLDSLERLMARQAPVKVSAEVLGEAHTAELEFSELEDFDPARITARFPALATLTELARELRVRGRAPAARRRLAELLDVAPAQVQRSETPPAPGSTAASEFSRLLGGDAAAADLSRRRPGATQAAELIRRAVDESAELEPGDDAALIGAVEQLCTAALRQVLADPALRRQERTWRSLHELVTSFDPEQGPALWLLRADLRTELPSGDATSDPAASPIGRVLRSDEALADAGIAAIVLDFELECGDDVALLGDLGNVARALGTTVLTSAPRALTALPPLTAAPSVEALASAWQSLRQADCAAHIAAAQPRLLLRLPYGRRGESSDLPGFEELTPAPEHEAFLWGNPAYGLALLLGNRYEQSGSWPPDLSRSLELENMPLAVYDDGTGDAIKPAAEVFLDEHDTQRLRDAGIMAFQSFRNRNAVRLAAFHPIADAGDS